MKKLWNKVLVIIVILNMILCNVGVTYASYIGDGSGDSGTGGTVTPKPPTSVDDDPAVDDGNDGKTSDGGSGEGDTIYNIDYILPLAWSGVVGLRSENNELDIQDYRISQEDFGKMLGKFDIRVSDNTPAVIEDLWVDNNRRTYSEYNSEEALEGITPELNYLIDNNIISRIEQVQLFSDMEKYYQGTTDLDTNFFKSDLLMALYKAKWGVIPSRLIYNVETTERNGASVESIEGYSVNGSIVNAKFLGDWSVYSFPSVYELYFSELINKGLVKLGDFSLKSFKEGYTQINEGNDLLQSESASYPTWSNSLAPMEYNVNDDGSGYVSNSLGESWTVGPGKKVNNETISGRDIFRKGKVNYFSQEKITTIQALKIIESFMNSTEKVMTKTEAGIITYKFGLNYLQELDEADVDTVSLMIAKGILNFEDEEEMSGFYDTLSTKFAHKLLYRFANKDARYDFSKVVMTDSDSFWQAKGFSDDTVSLVESSDAEVSEIDWKDAEVKQLVAKVNFLDLVKGWINPIPVIASSNASATAVATNEKKWQVTVKDITPFSKYTYNSISLEKISEYMGGTKSVLTEKEAEIVDSEIALVKVKTDSISIDFTITTTSASDALNYVKKRLKLKVSRTGEIKGVTSIKSIGTTDKSLTTMISKSQLTSSEFTTKSNIFFVSDNYLINSLTGTSAIILPEQEIALVGNRVFKDEAIKIITTDGDTYYNLSLICALLDDAYLKQISGTTSFIYKNVNEGEAYKVNNTYSTTVNKARVYTIDRVHDSNDSQSTKIDDYKLSKFLRIDTLSKGLNSISRRYKITVNGKEVDVTLLVDFEYVIPLDNLDDSNVYTSVNKGFKFSQADSLGTVLITPPEDKLYSNFWNDNLVLGNSLLNAIYGTDSFEYLTCGWLTPKLTVLVEGSNFTSYRSDIESKLFADLNSKLKKYGSTYTGTKWLNKFGLKVGLEQYRTYDYFNGSSLSLVKTSSTGDLSSGGATATYFSGYSIDTNFDATNTMDLGYVMDAKYVITNNGVLYQNMSSMENISYSTGNKTIKIKTRKDNWKDPYENTQYNVAINDYAETSMMYYLGIESVGTNKYYVLQPSYDLSKATPNISDVTYTNGNSLTGNRKPYFYGDVTNTAINLLRNSFLGQWYDLVLKGSAIPSTFTNAQKASKSFMFVHNGSLKKAKFPFYDFLKNNSTIEFVHGSAFIKYDTNKITKLTTSATKDTVSPMKLYYNVKDYTIKSEFDIIHVVDGNYLRSISTDIYFSGLNEKIIDIMYTDFIDAKPIESLVSGDKLLIGDLVFTKSADGWSSYPIESTSAQNNLSYTELLNIPSDSKLFSPLKSITVRVGGNEVSFISFLDKIVLGNQIVVTDKKSKVLFSNKENKPSIYDATTEKEKVFKDKATTPFTSYIISIEIKEGFKARPSGETNTYQMVLSSDSYEEGKFNSSPFYFESVDSGQSTDLTDIVTNNSFNVNEKASEFITSYRLAFQKEKEIGIKTLILTIFLGFSAIMVLMIWVSYGILKSGIGRPFLETITDIFSKNDSGKKFDLIKIISLTIFTMEDEPSILRVSSATVVLMIIQAILLRMLSVVIT